MTYQIDHDFHIHTRLSVCSQDEGQTPASILEYAKRENLRTVCITDHHWDEDIPCNTAVNFWYERQGNAHIRQSLPLPTDPEVCMLFGCEADMDSDNVIGLAPDKYDDFGFIVVSTTHFHHMGGPKWENMSNQDIANRWVERVDAVLDSDLPFHKTGIAHLTCYLINMRSREDYLETLQLIPQSELERVFTKAAACGIGIELNADEMLFDESETDIVMRIYRTAKACGCKFYLGSDSHERDAFLGVKEKFQRAIRLLDLQESDKFRV